MDSISSELLCSIHRLECADVTQLDQRTRKLMAMHNALHPKSNADCLYIAKKGCRGLQGCRRNKKLEKFRVRELCKRVQSVFLLLQDL